jgi:hypothetical protein
MSNAVELGGDAVTVNGETQHSLSLQSWLKASANY